MKSKTTFFWFILAAALAGSIWILDRYFQPVTPTVATLLPGLRADAVTSVQIIPAGASEITAHRTNQVWELDKPLVYPAQAAGIQSLLATLEKLIPTSRLTANDLRGKNTDVEFGLEKPLFSVVIKAGEQQWQFRIGSKTAPGDSVFIRVVGVDGLFLTGTDWLAQLPVKADDWRDTSLLALNGAYDRIVITNGTKTIEMRRDPTNRLWRLTQPLPARANEQIITTALQQLQAARIEQFVTNDPHADLTGYGLQPADLDLWFGNGTNLTTAVHVGKSPAGDATRLYVRRDNWNAVATAAKDTFTVWRGAVTDFRDRHLFVPNERVAEIEVRGETTNGFTLQLNGTNRWTVAGEKFSADSETVWSFLKQLYDLRVTKFVKDVNTAQDLQDFGLTPPARQITLRAVAGDTNSVTQLQFGAAQTNQVFVKRADEAYVYALAPEAVGRLPLSGWQFRERRPWNFSETNVTQLTLHQRGKTRLLVRTGVNKWSLATGQGIVDPVGLEQSASQLGGLTVVGWVARNPAEPEKFGLNPDNLQVIVELKSGEKCTLDFGLEFSETALCAVTLDGERWVGVLPPTVYALALQYLVIPDKAP